jgi:predicted small metal-binding protein
MARKYIDCRDHPGDVKCTVALSADTEEELMEAVVQHGKTVHGYEDTPEFRDIVRKGMKAGAPPA